MCQTVNYPSFGSHGSDNKRTYNRVLMYIRAIFSIHYSEAAVHNPYLEWSCTIRGEIALLHDFISMLIYWWFIFLHILLWPSSLWTSESWSSPFQLSLFAILPWTRLSLKALYKNHSVYLAEKYRSCLLTSISPLINSCTKKHLWLHWVWSLYLRGMQHCPYRAKIIVCWI